MGRHCQLVLGPAGAGKSTYCFAMHTYLSSAKRPHFLLNLDPAAENLFYDSENSADKSNSNDQSIANLDIYKSLASNPNVGDIRELITVNDVMEELSLGPNGGLIFCLEYLLENIEWLDTTLGYEPDVYDGDYYHSDDDDDDRSAHFKKPETQLVSMDSDEYLIIDMPGQLELFTHSTLVTRLIDVLKQRYNFHSICAVYLMDATYVINPTIPLSFVSSYRGQGSNEQDPELVRRNLGIKSGAPDKFFSGILAAISCMLRLGIPHVNVLSKMDLIEGRPGEIFENSSGIVDADAPKSGYANTWTDDERRIRDLRRELVEIDRFIDPDASGLLDDSTRLGDEEGHSVINNRKFSGLNRAIVQVIEDFSMVSLLPLNIHDEESLEALLYQVDLALQYGEDVEPKEPQEYDVDDLELMSGGLCD